MIHHDITDQKPLTHHRYNSVHGMSVPFILKTISLSNEIFIPHSSLSLQLPHSF